MTGSHFYWRLGQSQGQNAAGRVMSMTPSGIEPANFWLLSQYLNHAKACHNADVVGHTNQHLYSYVKSYDIFFTVHSLQLTHLLLGLIPWASSSLCSCRIFMRARSNSCFTFHRCVSQIGSRQRWYFRMSWASNTAPRQVSDLPIL
jgi:hypothetical protein